MDTFSRQFRTIRFIISKYVKEFQVYIVRARSYISEYGRLSALPVTNPGNEAYFSSVSELFIICYAVTISSDFSFSHPVDRLKFSNASKTIHSFNLINQRR